MTTPDTREQATTFDTEAIAREMRGEAAYACEGHTARTLVREADLRMVLVTMKTGSVIKEHRAAETASVHTLAGRLQLRLPERVVELRRGSILTLPAGLEHNVEALEESTFLLTLGWRGKP